MRETCAAAKGTRPGVRGIDGATNRWHVSKAGMRYRHLMQVGSDMAGVESVTELRRRVASELRKREDGNWSPKSIAWNAAVEPS